MTLNSDLLTSKKSRGLHAQEQTLIRLSFTSVLAYEKRTSSWDPLPIRRLPVSRVTRRPVLRSEVRGHEATHCSDTERLLTEEQKGT